MTTFATEPKTNVQNLADARSVRSAATAAADAAIGDLYRANRQARDAEASITAELARVKEQLAVTKTERDRAKEQLADALAAPPATLTKGDLAVVTTSTPTWGSGRIDSTHYFGGKYAPKFVAGVTEVTVASDVDGDGDVLARVVIPQEGKDRTFYISPKALAPVAPVEDVFVLDEAGLESLPTRSVVLGAGGQVYRRTLFGEWLPAAYSERNGMASAVLASLLDGTYKVLHVGGDAARAF